MRLGDYKKAVRLLEEVGDREEAVRLLTAEIEAKLQKHGAQHPEVLKLGEQINLVQVLDL